MASAAVRQTKPVKKGTPEANRRPGPAWGPNARSSPTFSPNNAPRGLPGVPQPGGAQGGSFPPLGQTNGGSPAPQDRVLQSLAGLTGTTITVRVKSGERYEGVIASTGPSGDKNVNGVSLREVKELNNGTSLPDVVFVAADNIEHWNSGPAEASNGTQNGDSFRTDTDISQNGLSRRERELQAWTPDASVLNTTSLTDELALDPGPGGAWDQFAVNEAKFGVKTSFDENLYTTKLDRSGADYKERERQAQKIANEIMGTTVNNSHIAEERNLADSGVNEEDKYSTVVRSQGAYVPPGARRGGPLSPPPSGGKSEIPKVSVNGPDGISVPAAVLSKPGSPAPAGGAATATKPAPDAPSAFRDFVTNEKQRLSQKRQALVKNDMEKKMADLKKFSATFKLNKPMPDDLVPILAKDEEKQKKIRDKTQNDAQSSNARSIASTDQIKAAGPVVANYRAPVLINAKSPPPSKSSNANAAPAPAKPSAPSGLPVSKSSAATPEGTKSPPKMVIQAIPPFKGRSPAPNNIAAPPMSPTTAQRLNVNANSFQPGGTKATTPPVPPPSTSPSRSRGGDARVPPTTPNPFFGTRPIKKGAIVNVKDDFNPFKHGKVPEASSVSALWPYNGKRYMMMFPPQHHQPPAHTSPHMIQPVPSPMPPPPYEEDPAARAAASGGYVYAPYPYAYPGQHMMPGMPPPGPPGAYIPTPYMQPMGYPPGMHPQGGQPMYAQNMGQMPPPGAYMAPPGTYPPPPNGAAGRPSMPPTPIPGHAHPTYYHQSPQLQHAVPYPMMMPPPGPNGHPAHPYEGGGPAPPVPMGGGGHA